MLPRQLRKLWVNSIYYILIIMENTVVLKIKGKNLQFRLPKSCIKNPEILKRLDNSEEIFEETDLPTHVISKLIM